MKITTPVFTKIVFGFALAGAIMACNNKPQPASQPATAAAPAQPAAETVVYINQDTLAAKYQYAVDLMKTLQEKGKSAQASVASKGQAIQHEIDEYKKNAATMPADQRQTTEQHLQREQEDFQSYQQNAAAGFQGEQVKTQNDIYNKIADFVKAYAKEKGYKLVLTYSKSSPTVLYGDPSLDVTADVVKRLNDASAKEKK